MSPLGHVTPLSAHAARGINIGTWTPTVIACIALILVGLCALALARECAE